MIYLLHFSDRIHLDRTTQHYVGYSARLSDRILAHLENRSGVSLINAAHERGINFAVSRVWQGERRLERHLKSLKNTPKFCPRCSDKPWQLYRPGSLKQVRELTGNRLKDALLFA
ncbi:endonuclease [Cyanobacteria bacterium FACHB-63]|nr:endonuclease [Cyanobacteria bacterium FACHB-63]